ncbi:MAG TPA: hypothetical protein PLD13_10295 [Methanoculleus sp.]|nr:hypothetical protein [Methanoculleus sp.]
MPDRIEGDGGVILISHPALLEVLEVIRKGITESKPYTDLDNGKKKAIKDKVQEKASLFLKALFRLTRGHRVVLVESQMPVDRWYKMTYSPFVSSSGDISTITIISATEGEHCRDVNTGKSDTTMSSARLPHKNSPSEFCIHLIKGLPGWRVVKNPER